MDSASPKRRLLRSRRVARLLGWAIGLGPLLTLVACTSADIRRLERAILEFLAVVLLATLAAMCAGIVYLVILVGGCVTAAMNARSPTPKRMQWGWIAAGLNLALGLCMGALEAVGIWAMADAGRLEPVPILLLTLTALLPLGLGLLNIALNVRARRP